MRARPFSVPDTESLLPSLDPTVYLTASLADAQRVMRVQGGTLFRLQGLFLVGSRDEARQWGWRRGGMGSH